MISTASMTVFDMEVNQLFTEPTEACEIPGCPECGTPKTPWSKNCEHWIRWMGHFQVTTKGDELKGRMLDEDSYIVKVYLSPKELRGISSACLEIATHLEKNISKATQPNAQDQTAGA